MTTLQIDATTAGLGRVTRALAGEPVRPGYVSEAGSLILYARSGRQLLVGCRDADLVATTRRIRQALGNCPTARISVVAPDEPGHRVLSDFPARGLCARVGQSAPPAI